MEIYKLWNKFAYPVESSSPQPNEKPIQIKLKVWLFFCELCFCSAELQFSNFFFKTFLNL